MKIRGCCVIGSWCGSRIGVGFFSLLLGLLGGLQAGTAATTLEAVRERGHILCGVSGGMPGFAEADAKGRWSGLMVEYCEAMAAGVLGSKDAVKIIPLSESERFQALASGAIDVLVPTAAWTLSRDTELGIIAAGTVYYDGQGFLVRRGDAVTSVLEMSGTTICVLTGTAAEQGVADFFKSHQMKYQLVVSERWSELVKAYEGGGCTLLTADVSLLAVERSRLAKPADHLLLRELITREPLGPAVREGDDQWFRIARWTLMALVAAEDLGLTSEGADAARTTAFGEAKRLLGVEHSLGQALGLEPEWGYRIVKQVGNYGEIFERTLGMKSRLLLDRGLNALWNKGGIQYAAPFR